MTTPPTRATIDLDTPEGKRDRTHSSVLVERRGDQMTMLGSNGSYIVGTPQNMRTLAFAIIGMTKDLPPEIKIDGEGR